MFIKSPLIQLGVEASNWKDAIIKSGQPLLNEKLITKDYLRAVINIAEESGPYIVFTPHVALSHAHPEDGALKDGIGFAILKNPISFGNKDNDPVKYIFTLSAVETGGHLKQMTELVKILSEPNFFKNINNAKSNLEISKYMNELAEK